jgi:hypothetical protein
MAEQEPNGTEHAARGGGRDHTCVELCPICRGAEVLRATATPEMRDQWRSVQREALQTMRALIDHYIERLEQEEARSAPGPRVEEIPID